MRWFLGIGLAMLVATTVMSVRSSTPSGCSSCAICRIQPGLTEADREYLEQKATSEATPVPKTRRTDDQWRAQLTPEEYQVTRQCGTERAFTGKYWNHHEPGVYRCVCCGQELFSSEAKFDSGSGWPSFTMPVRTDAVGTSQEDGFFLDRTEIHCSKCQAHLGHVFSDGPLPTGLRFCVNSVALEHIPAETAKDATATAQTAVAEQSLDADDD